MAPQPVTLKMDDLKINNPHSILRDYAVTEKADGERYQMMIMEQRGYLIKSLYVIAKWCLTIKFSRSY